MNEYNALKERRPNDLVFYQIGDAFEVYGEDANKVAALLGVEQTTRALSGAGRVNAVVLPLMKHREYAPTLSEEYAKRLWLSTRHRVATTSASAPEYTSNVADPMRTVATMLLSEMLAGEGNCANAPMANQYLFAFFFLDIQRSAAMTTVDCVLGTSIDKRV